MLIKKIKAESLVILSASVPRPGIEPGWVAPLVFETSASTDSAIWAFLECDAKVRLFFVFANIFAFFLKKLFVFFAIPLKRSNFASRLLSALTMGFWHYRSLSMFTGGLANCQGMREEGFCNTEIPLSRAEWCRDLELLTYLNELKWIL